MQFVLQKQSGEPLYQQLAAQLQAAIEAGQFREGEKLPTEAELFDQLGVSKGTIKAAYDQLQQMGYISKVQGSGAYVQCPTGAERKARAALLAGQLFDELTGRCHLSVTQAYGLFCEELNHMLACPRAVCAALVDASEEILTLAAQALAAIPGLKVRSYRLEDVLEGRAYIEPECDFVLTTQAHYEELLKYTAPRKLRLEQMGLAPASETVAGIAKIPPGRLVGILYRSQGFGERIRETLSLLEHAHALQLVAEGEAHTAFAQADVSALTLIVPPDYRNGGPPELQPLLDAVQAAGGQVLPFQYRVDQGSLLHLEHKVRTFYGQKNGCLPEAKLPDVELWLRQMEEGA